MSARARVPARHRSPDIGEAIAFRIHRTNRLLLTHLNRFLTPRAKDLSAEKWFVLARLRERGPTPQADLADPTLGDAPNISRLIDAMERVGLVERKVNPDDRRGRLVGLTADGGKLADEILQAAVEERARVFVGLSAGELTALTAMLDRVDANLTELLGDDETA